MTIITVTGHYWYMGYDRLYHLLEKQLEGSLSEQEERELGTAISDKDNVLLVQAAADLIGRYGSTSTRWEDQTEEKEIFQRVVSADKPAFSGSVEDLTRIPVIHRVHFLKTTWFRYAAAIVLIVATAAIFYKAALTPRQIAKEQTIQRPDILPGGNKATLTLSDGTTIILDSATNGSLTSQGNTKIIKLNAGSLAYEPGDEETGVFYNTINTPKGGQYQIVLPDGSKVWLNAASSIRFPTAFIKDRKVTVTGEAYFEIANDPRKPFSVSVHDAEISVLGTSFNINAYEDEPAVTTTLLEGSVRMNVSRDAQTLKPGQQAVVNVGPGTPSVQLVNNADINQVMAWQRGAFSFNNTALEVVMRQLSRWYNVEIVYKNRISGKTISGGMGRDLNLSEVMDVLKGLGVNASMEGRRLIIDKKY